MLDSRSGILTANTFIDEFEVANKNSVNARNEQAIDAQEQAFNAKISDNLDRIMHYDQYNTQNVGVQNNVSYNNNYVEETLNADLTPSGTTMQFYGLNKSQINEDLRVEDGVSYKTATKPSLKTKTMLLISVAVMVMLSVLIVFNTAMLKNLANIENAKLENIQSLEQISRSKDAEILDVSSDEAIIEAAKELGMEKRV